MFAVAASRGLGKINLTHRCTLPDIKVNYLDKWVTCIKVTKEKAFTLIEHTGQTNVHPIAHVL